MSPFGLAEVERAAQRIAGRVHRTPVIGSRLLDRELGCRALLKAEHLQRVGAFKARGAFNALLALDPATRAPGWSPSAPATTPRRSPWPRPRPAAARWW